MKIYELSIDFSLHGTQIDLKATDEAIFFLRPKHAVFVLDYIF